MCMTWGMRIRFGAGCLVALAILLFLEDARAADKTIRNSLDMEFVLISPGTFDMGSPKSESGRSNKELQRRVTLTKVFYLQTTEVTLKQWWEIMGKRFFGRRKGTGDTPAHRISWLDCMEFIEKLNARGDGVYRLPTEAEWEYACRAGTDTVYSWGDGIECARAMYENSDKAAACMDYAKSRGLPQGAPAPVRSYPPNPWGLYDMHGNVWEWCMDWYGNYPEGSVTDPKGTESGPGRVRRGGSWFKYGTSCRSANRNYGHPPTRYRTTGFRLVREVE